MYFTIGQRKDLGIGGPGEPWYVADKDMSTNRLLVVQGRNHSRLWKQKVFVENLHWLDPDIKGVLENKQTLGCFAKNRYRQKDAKCEIRIIAGGLEVDFNEPQWAITYGQYIVFYLGDKCLGGGKIMPKHCELD
jgi:tRNA-specific 2-thiouridylase